MLSKPPENFDETPVRDFAHSSEILALPKIIINQSNIYKF
jgi:hypothetical protein